MVVSKRDDLGDSSDEQDAIMTIPKKFKADTDHQNLLFEQSIKQRSHAASQNYLRNNKTHLQSLSQNKLPKPRFELPENIEYHPYGN